MLGAATLADGAELLARLSPDETIRVAEIARRHAVEPWLAACAPSGTEFAPLRQQRSLFLAAQARTLAVARDLYGVFAQLDCPWVVLKGPALAYSVYPRPDLRHGVDLDVLVPPVRFGDVLDGLSAAGFTLLDQNWPLIDAKLPGELRLRAPTGLLLDLHWAVLVSPAVRRRFHLPTLDLLARARVLEPPGLPMLSAVDQLLHLGAHGTLSGGNRLAWLLDVHLAAFRTTDWDAVAESASSAGVGTALGLLLARAGRLWPSPAPRAVVRRLLNGPLWAAVDRVVDGASVLRADPDEGSRARAWAHSVSATRTAMVADFASRGFARLGNVRPTATEDLLLRQVDDPDARRRYLASVAAAE